jgi:hypothetical protein
MVAVPAAVSPGGGMTLTATVFEAVQVPTVWLTVYVVVAPGVTTTGLPVIPPGDQEKLPGPVTVRLELCPLQIVLGVAATVLGVVLPTVMLPMNIYWY